MPRTPEQSYSELLRRVREAAVLNSCSSLLAWDERTYLPPKGSAHRAEQMALLARLSHEMVTAPVVGELLAEVEGSPLVREPNGDAAANVREIRHAYDRAVKLPRELVEEMARVCSRAQLIWQEARAKSNFAHFRPWLEKIVALKVEQAKAIGYQGVPYDALLDEYEPGVTTAEVTRIFAGLREELAALVAGITSSSRRPRTDVLH